MSTPSELVNLVKTNLPPSAKITEYFVDPSGLAYKFTIIWYEITQSLVIRRGQWDDQQLEIIRLLARLSVPSPEATRGGKRFWIYYDDSLVEAPGDYTIWPYFICLERGKNASPFKIKISNTVHALLDYEATNSVNDKQAFRIAAGLWHLKHCFDRTDDLTSVSQATLNSDDVELLLRPSRLPDNDIRHYVEQKVYQGYLGSGGNIQQEFDWIDFRYLGISEQDFTRAIDLKKDKDWEIDGLQVRPTSSLLERLDARESQNPGKGKPSKKNRIKNQNPAVYGKWEKLDPLKEGGQSHTFFARDSTNPDDDRKYVLKRLKNPDRIGRFQQEIEIGLKLNHPNLVKVVDFDLQVRKPYLVTEYYEGGDLQTNFEGKVLSPIAALKLFVGVCRGVAYAHEMGVIHRDLKPSNIFLKSTIEGEPVVGDFGICHVENGERFTIMEEAVGPIFYMAPELEDGRVQQVSLQSDIYSLGKVLYWMLTGNMFAREKHRSSDYDLVKKSGNSLLEHVSQILDNAIVNDPDLRFPNVPELIHSVEEAMQMLEGGFNPIGPKIRQKCIYCGKGTYQKVIDPQSQDKFQQGQEAKKYFNLGSVGTSIWMVLVCNNCGNTQIFRPDLGGGNLQAWGCS